MGLSRKQIAQFVGNDPEAIRAIEELFRQADTLVPGEFVAILAQLRDAAINQAASSIVAREAIDAANRLASAIEALQAMPVQQVTQADENHVPVWVPTPAEKAPLPVQFSGASGTIDTSTTVTITVHNGIITEIV